MMFRFVEWMLLVRVRVFFNSAKIEPHWSLGWSETQPRLSPGRALARDARMEPWREHNGAPEGLNGDLLRERGIAASVLGIAAKWGELRDRVLKKMDGLESPTGLLGL